MLIIACIISYYLSTTRLVKELVVRADCSQRGSRLNSSCDPEDIRGRTTRDCIVHIWIRMSGFSGSAVVVSCSQDKNVRFQRVCCGLFLFTGSGCEVSACVPWLQYAFTGHIQPRANGWGGFK